MNELALFAGTGGGLLGGSLLGWRTLCGVEINPYCASVLAARQNDGLLPPFPIWDDVCTFDGKPWRGIIDVVSGGFPCQDISVAGRGEGITGPRSGLWREMARIVGEVRPRYVFVENSPAIVTRGLGVVLGDLAALGYDARWTVLGAADVGAPHQRERLWIVAHLNGLRESQPQGRKPDQWGRLGDSPKKIVSDPHQPRLEERQLRAGISPGKGCNDHWQNASLDDWWVTEPDLVRVVHGVPARVDRISALGNAQVPQCAAAAWRILTGPMK